MGRPRKNIDPEMVRKLAFLGCSYYEMGRILGADESVIRRRFAADKEQAESRGNMRLRRAQLKRALKGSDTMLIHLGKQRLGQTDRLDIQSKGESLACKYVDRANNPRDRALTSTNGDGHTNGSVAP